MRQNCQGVQIPPCGRFHKMTTRAPNAPLPPNLVRGQLRSFKNRNSIASVGAWMASRPRVSRGVREAELLLGLEP